MSLDYEIRIPHFYCLEYEERGRVMLLEIDFRDPVLYLDSALVTGWQAPADKEVVTPTDKVRILTNVYDYLVRQRGFDKVELDLS
jgi:translation elongation factor EF-Tu-like GTPase